MQQFVETSTISHELALRIVTVAIEKGLAVGLPVAVAVADPGMTLVAYAKADGTTPHSEETSRRKAQTSASTRRPSGWMPPELAAMLPAGSGNRLTNIKGGLPIRFDGRFVGGFGVAGGAPEKDAEIAMAVLREIGADPVEG
jgi:glc operon protein GlcG